MITGGDTLGMVYENELFQEHRIMAEPLINGRITHIEESGHYNVTQPVVTYEDAKSGKEEHLRLAHFWPVRKPRPTKNRLPAVEPLLTG
jgi:V-type H+-transporting ATPase subunit A